MLRAITISIILILGLAFSSQDQGETKILTPEFNAADLSIPKSINFQGYLYRDGNPMDTTMNIWFGIYDAPSSGTQLFQQTINNVTVTKGWFTVSLDNIPNSVFPVGGPTRYLEVKAPSTGPALSPRISLVSVGYSYHAITADSAEYAKSSPIARPITPPISGAEIAKPCTLQASVSSPGAVLRVKNTGTGDGIRVDSARNGVYIDRTGSCGVQVYRAGSSGVYIDSAGYGVYVSRANSTGVSLGRAGFNGFSVDSAGNGMRVYRASSSGVSIDRAGSNGVYIDSAGSYGVRVDLAGSNGVYIKRAGQDGIVIDRAHSKGVYVDSAGSGFQIYRANGTGFGVNRAGYDGVFVDSAGYDGVNVNRAERFGINIESAGSGISIGSVGSYGIEVDNAGYDGVHIDSVGDDGIEINRVGENGVFVHQAGWAGVRVARADYNGVLVDSSSVYGVKVAHTPYGIFANGNQFAGYFDGNFLVTNGTKSAAVKVGEGDYRLLYCQESPEVWFEDAGEGQLTNGKVHIELEPVFLKTVTISEQYPMKVFVQLTSGNPTDVVIKKGSTGFDVIAENPISNATFDYRIMAKRKGFENLRLKKMEPGTNPEELEAKHAKIQAEEKTRRENEHR